MSSFTSLGIQLPQSSQITVSSPPTAGVWTKAASAVLQGDGSGEALLLGRRMVPNRAHPLPPFAVISTRLGANITISCEEGTPLVSLGSHGSSSEQHLDREKTEEAKGKAVVVSCVHAIDSGLTAIYNTLAVARSNHRSTLAKAIVDAREGIGRGTGITNEKPSEPMSIGLLSSARAAPPPVALVVGVKGSGRTTLVRQLGNLFYEEDTLASGGGGGTEGGGILAVVSGDVTSGGSSGTSLPGALSCDFITNEPVQPLTYFCGSTCVDTPKASNRYLDIATYMAQGLEVLQLEAVGKAANAHSAAMASEQQSAGSSVDNRATLDLSKCLAAVLVDTVGLPSSLSSSIFSFSESSKEFGLVREMSDIFKATHVIAVGRTSEEAALLASKLKASVAAFRKVEIFTYAPNHSTNTVAVACDTRKTAVFTDTVSQHKLCMRVHRPIAEYFSGSLHRPLAPHLQVFAVSELIFLDAVTFAVVSPPTSALQGTLAAVPFRAPIEHIDAASVCGFVIIKEIGTEYVSLLCPSRGRLPSSVLLVTSIPAPPSLMVSVTF